MIDLLKWEPGYDGEGAESERFEYSVGGKGVGGIGPWLSITIERKSDGKMFEKIWYDEVPIDEMDPYIFCEAFEDGYVIVFPWEWKRKEVERREDG
jgi:hypothetical protein